MWLECFANTRDVLRNHTQRPPHRVADYVSKALKKEDLQGTTENICLIGGQ